MRLSLPTCLSLCAAAAVALAGCASDEVKKAENAPAPVATVPPRTNAVPATRPTAPPPRVTIAPTRKAEPSAAVAAMPTKNSVYYDFDRYDIKPEFRPLVEQHARYISSNPSAKVIIEGNCDERGSREYNLALGQRRADSFRDLLKVMGLPASRVETVSYGEEKPKSQGHDESFWSQNRRSDILYSR